MLDDEGYREHREARWAELTPEQRARAAAIVNAWIPTADRAVIGALIDKKPLHWIGMHHFGWGMALRNALRTGGFKDAEVPSGNLDDYYIQIVEFALCYRN